MVKNEEALNPVLWRYYTDAELKSLEAQCQQVLQPVQAAA
jgi:hypothetical protein